MFLGPVRLPSPFGLPFGKVSSLNLASVWASVPEVELKQKQTDANGKRKGVRCVVPDCVLFKTK